MSPFLWDWVRRQVEGPGGIEFRTWVIRVHCFAQEEIFNQQTISEHFARPRVGHGWVQEIEGSEGLEEHCEIFEQILRPLGDKWVSQRNNGPVPVGDISPLNKREEFAGSKTNQDGQDTEAVNSVTGWSQPRVKSALFIHKSYGWGAAEGSVTGHFGY